MGEGFRMGGGCGEVGEVGEDGEVGEEVVGVEMGVRRGVGDGWKE